MNNTKYRLLKDETQQLIEKINQINDSSNSDFENAQKIAKIMGVHKTGENAQICFWCPEIDNETVQENNVFIEIFTPIEKIDFYKDSQDIKFDNAKIPLKHAGDFYCGVVSGMVAGTRDYAGTFYQVFYKDNNGKTYIHRDPLAYSLPFGTHAPAEYYDIKKIDEERKDKKHFANLDAKSHTKDGLPQVLPPVNILQLHVNTATKDGSLAGLTKKYRSIANKIRNNKELTAEEKNYTAYDSVQLMPIEPLVENPSHPKYWEVSESKDNITTVKLRKTDMINWGYDIVMLGSPAVSSTVIESRRPDELADFIAELHNFPNKPIKVIFDIVYGHTDNQALELLPEQYLAGYNMYGQNLRFKHPVTRAVLLEMQRRKNNYGVDCVRVDGAQDFKYYDPETQKMYYDDDYLQSMSDIVQEVAGQKYHPWMIFEDGRPWPDEDWELTSTYREVIKKQPDTFQWSPLTFAHNTPFLFTFWINKWWRIREMAEFGSHWITGCANHDTLRRGTQIDPESRINNRLGDTLPEIFKKAYNNPSATMFTYAFLPGVPMDFINALMNAPWSYVRNTDDKYGVKVMSEETYFLDWAVDPKHYEISENFTSLKEYGFTTLAELRRFIRVLDSMVKITNYKLEDIVRMMNHLKPELATKDTLTADKLKNISYAWAKDVYDYCNVGKYIDEQKDKTCEYNYKVREFRRQRKWLMDDLKNGDILTHKHPTEGTVFFYGLRTSPDSKEQILFLANMEGAPITVTPSQLDIKDLTANGWKVALSTPDLNVGRVGEPLTLQDSEAVIFLRNN